MNQPQEAKLDMYNAVISHCTQNAAIIAGLPALKTAFDLFKSTIASITSTAQEKAQVITGITADKKMLRKDLVQQTADIAFRIYAYATTVGNNQMKQQVKYSITKLVKLKDEELFNVCTNITGIAGNNANEFADYGITDAILVSLNEALTAYKAAVPRPRNAASNRTSQIKALVDLFITADDILKNRMDKMITTFKATEPRFYTSYIINRIIVDPPSTVTQLKGIVTDANTKIPVSDAKIEVLDSTIATTTGVKGRFTLKPLTHGVYSLKVSREGYRPLTVTDMPVKLGQVNVTDITLSPGNE